MINDSRQRKNLVLCDFGSIQRCFKSPVLVYKLMETLINILQTKHRFNYQNLIKLNAPSHGGVSDSSRSHK